MEKALAHISEDGTRTQTVYEHLSGTAHLAGAFATPFGAKEEAEYAAWLHDIGKYSAAFQQRLAGGAATDHSTAGAQEAMKGCAPHVQAAFAVAGHHTGLPDGGNKRAADSADGTLFGRLKKSVEPYDGWREVTLPQSAPPDWANRDPLDFAFFTRMLYSCLVDADFIDTETFMNGQAAPRGSSTALSSLLEKVRTKAAGYLAAQSTLPVGSQRNAVLRACMEKGAHGAPGLYTLTVPTGGGKTFASLAFALEQAAAQGMKRVIYVIPYMSIIDQTAAVFADLLGAENVLDDYSCADYKSLERENLTSAQYRQLLASENWDAPVVVTTAVQFFESLYANRSSRCRKLHNIANSVIIFDEAQTLPTSYLLPCVSAIAQLVRHYHATAVLCTATQPALEPYFRQFAPELPLQEIVPDTATLYTTLRRTTLCDAGELTLEALTSQLCALPQVLCVVNRRKTAQSFALRGMGDAGTNGGPAGDVIVMVSVRPSEVFQRDGYDVWVTVPITYSQAVLGDTVQVPSIDGKVEYTVPEGTQSGTTFRLRGKGIQYLNGRGRGDMYVKCEVEIPKKLNKTQRDALKKFEGTLKEENYEKRKGFFKKLKDMFNA